MARFLIVDDEPLIAMLAQDWLEDLGHQTVGPAHDLKTALRLTQEPMDAAILDVSLGADKSFEVARRLRAQHVPVRFRDRTRAGVAAAKGSGRADACQALQLRDVQRRGRGIGAARGG